MKKYNWVIKDNNKIDGYTNIVSENIDQVTNGTVSELLINDIDAYPFEQKINNIVVGFKKLIDGGTLTLRFYNFTKIAKELLKGNLNSQSISNIINECRSVIYESDVLEIISKTGGMRLQKTFNDNYHTVMVIQKRL